jgi:hypothetical protein
VREGVEGGEEKKGDKGEGMEEGEIEEEAKEDDDEEDEESEDVMRLEIEGARESAIASEGEIEKVDRGGS